MSFLLMYLIYKEFLFKSTNQSTKIYLATLDALQGDSKVAWANTKLPPNKTHKNNTIK